MMDLAMEARQGGSELSLSSICRILSLSRSGVYREVARFASEEEMSLRDEIQRIALKWSCYGYRRVTRELSRRGRSVNSKRVLRLMRLDNLLCLRKRRFVATTDSSHGRPVYPNLARELEVDGLNQLWVSDLTYIRLEREFVYLAVVVDAFSRRCIGWSLGRRLDESLALAALREALLSRQVSGGLVHHSDRGVQYTSKAYTELLASHGVTISMSRVGNPYDNAFAESFIKTLKYEEVYLTEYRTLEEAHVGLMEYIDEVYNRRRLHSSLGYVPPVEFESALQVSTAPS